MCTADGITLGQFVRACKPAWRCAYTARVRDVRFQTVVGIGIACLTASSVPAADPNVLEIDPWNGKPRSEVVKLLGEPTKTKTARDGRETLTYAFDRIAPDAPPHPEVMLLHVPGIGVVARILRGRTPSELLGMGLPVYDETGRADGGRGLTQPTGTSTSRNSTSSQEMPRLLGKVKLRLVLDGDGRVESWSVSGNK